MVSHREEEKYYFIQESQNLNMQMITHRKY